MSADRRSKGPLEQAWSSLSAPLGRFLGEHHVHIGAAQDQIDAVFGGIPRAIRNALSTISGRNSEVYQRMDGLLHSLDGNLPGLFVEQNKSRVLFSDNPSPAILSVGPIRFPASYWREPLQIFASNDYQIHHLGFHPEVRTWEELRKSSYQNSLRRVLRHAHRSRNIYNYDRDLIGERAPCIGVGSSAGSLLLLLAAIKNPEAFSALVCTSTPSLVDGEIRRMLKNAHRAAVAGDSLAPGVKSGTLGALDLFLPHDAKPPESLSYLNSLPARPMVEIRTMERDIFAGVHRLNPDMPVIFIHGERDGLCSSASVRRLMKRMPTREKELIELPGAGHLLAFGHSKASLTMNLQLVIADLMDRQAG